MAGGLWCIPSPASAACCVGLPKESQVFEAKGSRVALSQAGGLVTHQGKRVRGKASLPALAEGEGVQHCH